MLPWVFYYYWEKYPSRTDWIYIYRLLRTGCSDFVLADGAVQTETRKAPSEHQEMHFYCEGDQALAQAVWCDGLTYTRCWLPTRLLCQSPPARPNTLGGIQKPCGHSPEQLALGNLAWTVKGTRWSPEVLSTLSLSVILWCLCLQKNLAPYVNVYKAATTFIYFLSLFLRKIMHCL